jgi:hypothetical protein
MRATLVWRRSKSAIETRQVPILVPSHFVNLPLHQPKQNRVKGMRAGQLKGYVDHGQSYKTFYARKIRTFVIS